jgi:hypothetical protein
MSKLRLWLPAWTALTLWLAGCASSHPELVLRPVGPPPGGTASPGRPGQLQVFSALDTSANFNTTPYRQRYTDYEVYSAEGKERVRDVRNDTGKLLDGAAAVSLPPGNYKVIARANGYGKVTVPVLIQADQTTIVHLEGSHWWPRSSAIFDSNPVRLPNGQIVGWPVLASGAE